MPFSRGFPIQGSQVDSLPSEPPGKPQSPDGILSLIFYVHARIRAQSFMTPWIVACQAPLSKEFSRQEYWIGLPFPPPGDLPDTRLLHLLPSQAGSLPLAPHGKPMSSLSFGNPLIH